MLKKKIRIAYLLLAHKNPEQLNKFTEQLSMDKFADIYVHIDKKNYVKMSSEIDGKNITILKERVDISWGDISLVDAAMCLLREAVNSGRKYDFVCLRSGQDLLVRSGLADYLELNRHKLFMNAWKMDGSGSGAYFWRIKWPRFTRRQYDSAFHPFRIFRSALIRLYKLGINFFPNPKKMQMDIYRGSQWFCVPGYAAEYIVNFVANNVWYYEFFKDSLAPDEYFFQTLLMNSEYVKDNVCNNLTYIRFGQTKKDNNHAATLTMADVPEIEQSNKFFARKFDRAVDSEVIEYFAGRC
ncbi:MAG: hypothetical protein M0018_04150 [Nitrospiraceae bacterium]|nr:hypothetical protein [Nitrospiraceae bacterium]